MNTSWIRQQHFEYDRFFTKYIFVKKPILLRIYISIKKKQLSYGTVFLHNIYYIYIYIYNFFFDGQFRLFSFSDSNTYLDTEISIISLRFGGLEITLVWFSPLFARFSLCLHFTFLSLTVARGVLFKILSPLFHVV